MALEPVALISGDRELYERRIVEASREVEEVPMKRRTPFLSTKPLKDFQKHKQSLWQQNDGSQNCFEPHFLAKSWALTPMS
jgi:hypothetical protein